MFGYGHVERFYQLGITTGCAVVPASLLPARPRRPQSDGRIPGQSVRSPITGRTRREGPPVRPLFQWVTPRLLLGRRILLLVSAAPPAGQVEVAGAADVRRRGDELRRKSSSNVQCSTPPFVSLSADLVTVDRAEVRPLEHGRDQRRPLLVVPSGHLVLDEVPDHSPDQDHTSSPRRCADRSPSRRRERSLP